MRDEDLQAGRAKQAIRAVLRLRRPWLLAHLFGLSAFATMIVGGLIGQRCPALPIGQGSLKSGPFAYEDGAVTEALWILMAFLCLAMSVVALIGTPWNRALEAIRSLLNIPLVGLILIWSMALGAGQAQRAILCDADNVRTELRWFAAAVVAVLVINVPFAAHSHGPKEEPR